MPGLRTKTTTALPTPYRVAHAVSNGYPPMTPVQFRELCRGASRLLDFKDIDALFESRDTRIDGVKLGVFHNDDEDPEGIYCYVDLGAMGSAANPQALMEEVLAINLSLDASLGEVIGLERDSRHLVLRVRLNERHEPFHEGELAAQLQHYAGIANELYRRVLTGVERP